MIKYAKTDYINPEAPFFCPKACIYYRKKLSLHYLCNKTFLAKKQ